MSRILCALRRNILSQIVSPSYIGRATVTTSTPKLKCKSSTKVINGITVMDISAHELAKDDPEFSQNFLTTLPSLRKGLAVAAKEALSTNAPNEPCIPDEETEVPEWRPTDCTVIGPGNIILNKDGEPIMIIDIDNWRNMGYEADIEEVIEQDPGVHKELENNTEYKPVKNGGQLEKKDTK